MINSSALLTLSLFLTAEELITYVEEVVEEKNEETAPETVEEAAPEVVEEATEATEENVGE